MREKMTTKAIKRIDTKEELCPEDFKYDYNPHLTKMLDNINDDFDQNIINKIVLWKVNRHPYVPEDLMTALNETRNDTALRNTTKSCVCGCWTAKVYNYLWRRHFYDSGIRASFKLLTNMLPSIDRGRIVPACVSIGEEQEDHLRNLLRLLKGSQN